MTSYKSFVLLLVIVLIKEHSCGNRELSSNRVLRNQGRRSLSIGKRILSQRNLSGRNDVDFTRRLLGPRNDVEFTRRLLGPRNDVEFTRRLLGPRNDVEFTRRLDSQGDAMFRRNLEGQDKKEKRDDVEFTNKINVRRLDDNLIRI